MYLFSGKTSSSPETNASLFPTTKENRRPAAFSPRPSSLSSSPSVSSSSPSLSLSSSKRTIAIAVPAVVFIVVVLICVIIWIYRYKRKKRNPEGNEIDVENRADDSCAGDSMLLRRGSFTHVSEVSMPLDGKQEIDRKAIILQGSLGEGAFGRVMKAEVLGMPEMHSKKIVAVKMPKEDSDEKECRDLLSELEIMRTIGEHNNIINLIGGCTQGGKLTEKRC
ncbi:Fibroblast growth factorreceptor 4 [Porites harrisoni]